MDCRSDWTREEIRAIHDSPFLDLVYRAASIHRAYQRPNEVQVCSILSIKTGGCPEDCKYCPQSSRYKTDVKATPLMQEDEILAFALDRIANGATRVCLGAAWRSVRDGEQFDRILRVVRKITDAGIEVCCTLGMLTQDQANRLKEAGVYAYNHNLDTSPEYYPQVSTTRRYEDRLDTLAKVEKAGIGVCCGGIIGLGESIDDRIGLLHVLATRNPHPESVPINFLARVAGTPFGDNERPSIWEMVRMIATARITMPKAMVRLACGRMGTSLEGHALCFLAGANSLFMGEKLLTRDNPQFCEDHEMLRLFGLAPRPPFAEAL